MHTVSEGSTRGGNGHGPCYQELWSGRRSCRALRHPTNTWKTAVTLSAMEREVMFWGVEQGGSDSLSSRDQGEI